MQNNLNLSGSGMYRTYEESYFRRIDISFDGHYKLGSYRNKYFLKPGGNVVWYNLTGTTDEEFFLEKRPSVEVLNVIYMGNDKLLIEYIDSNILEEHLNKEANELRESIDFVPEETLGTNDIILGKIPVNGDGFHRTYRESVIRLITNFDCFWPYNNAYFMHKTGYIHWADSEEKYNETISSDEYKRVVLLKTFTFGNNILVEFIQPEILHMHLQKEDLVRKHLSEKSSLSLKPNNL